MLAVVNTVVSSSSTPAPPTTSESTVISDVTADSELESLSNRTLTNENEQIGSGNSDTAADTENGSGNATDSQNNNNNNLICRFHLKGACRYGALCRFSHDISNIEDINNTAVDGPSTSSSSITKSRHISNWADAPIFVPGRIKFDLTSIANTSLLNMKDGSQNDQSETVSCNSDDASTSNGNSAVLETPAATWASVVGGVMYGVGSHHVPNTENAVCPFEFPCPHGAYCIYSLHFELCEMCDQYCLHPTDQEQRRKHKKECLQQHEQAMELSFAIARSKDKTCGICFDIIMEKSGREKRFGILPNCNHIFCLECIRKWRQAKQFEHKITRSCPECRIASDFVCPSAFWVETKEEKDKLLTDYRAALGIKDCKYFKKGEGLCPFGNKCFYKHALPDGKLVDVGLPKRARKVRRSSTEFSDLLDVFLWEYVDHRDLHWFDGISSESDDSDFDEAGFVSDH